MVETREVLIQLRYARQKIEYIEAEIQKSSAIASGELRVKVDGAIGALHIVKGILGGEIAEDDPL